MITRDGRDQCKDCRHACKKVKEYHTCKLNFVQRHAYDSCIWDTKKDPSRFEQRTLDDPPKDIIEELERFLIWRGGLVDDEDKRNGVPPSDVVLDEISKLKLKWGWT